MPEENQQQPQVEEKKQEADLSNEYANNVAFEYSAWDLKLIFGQLDQRPNKQIVEWHTAITVPWAVAKIIAYYLQINIAAYEHANGRIQIPANVVPALPEPPSGEAEQGDGARAIYEAATEAHQRLFD